MISLRARESPLSLEPRCGSSGMFRVESALGEN